MAEPNRGTERSSASDAWRRIRSAGERHPMATLFLLAFFANLVIESMARLSVFGGAAYLLERPVPFLLTP